MKILSLKVMNVGPIRGEVEIPSFDDRLTVIHGPNETGKSTLVRALRAALFERHKAGHHRVEELQPWNTNESPEIWVTLEIDGVRIEIHKRFKPHPCADLIIHGLPRREFHGDAADEQIREFLGTQMPGAQGARDDQLGIWPLLLVSQGSAIENPISDLGQAARDRLDTALRKVVGDVIGGPRAQPLLAAAREELVRFWTPRNMQPTGDYRTAIKTLEEAKGALTKARQAWEQSSFLAESLTQTTQALVAEEKTLEETKAERIQADRKLEELTRVQQQREKAEACYRAADADWNGAREAWQGRQQLIRDINDRWKLCKADEDRLQPLRIELAEAEAEWKKTEQQHLEAEQAARQAGAHHRRLLSDRDLIHLRTRLQQEQARLQRSESLLQEIRQRKDQLDRMLVTPSELEGLTDLEKELATARARLEAAAVRLSIAARHNISLQVGQEPAITLAEGESRSMIVSDRQSIELADVAYLTIEPGGKDLRKLREALDRLESDYGKRLGELGVSSLAEARSKAQERAEEENELSSQNTELKTLVPEEPETLRQAVSRLTNQIACLEAQRDASRPLPTDDEIDSLINDADTQRQDAEEQAKPVKWKLGALTKEAAQLRQILNTSEGSLRTARQEIEKAERRLAEARQQIGSDQVIEQRSNEAFQKRQGFSAALEALEHQWDQMDPETVRDNVDRLAGVVVQREKAIENLEQRKISLKTQITMIGAEGRYEKLDQAESAWQSADLTHRNLDRQARAARRLCLILEEEYRQSMERYIQPLKEQIAPLLRILLPGCEVRIDDNLELQGLQRDGTPEDFRLLSGGMREQLSVLARLAMARVLSGTDGALPVVLDDSLVWTDDQRFERMITAIRQASKSLQIIILTCHRDRYTNLAAGQFIDLLELKRTATAQN